MRIRAQDTNFIRAHYNKMRAEHYRMNTSGLDKECASIFRDNFREITINWRELLLNDLDLA